jgi:DNA polymerase II small subunit
MESSLIQLFKESGVSESGLVELSNSLIGLRPEKIVSKDFFMNNLNKLLVFSSEPEIKKFLDSFKMPDERKEEKIIPISKDVEIIDEVEIQNKKIVVEDFVYYYRDRYITLKNFFQDKVLENLCSIGKLADQQRNVSIIGLVYDKRVTKNRNILLELEDLTGRVTVLIRQDKKEIFDKANDVVLDEVISVKGVGSKEIIFANEILTLDSVQDIKKCPEEIYAAFTADIHVGSKKFYEENFLKFIDWLNGSLGTDNQKETALKVKYLFIVGDTVDGVGVYPRQESELLIKDIKEQYAKLAEMLKKIRKEVTIILCPGGKHDAVVQIEPQPRLPKEIAPALYEMENLILIPNPSFVKIASSKEFIGFNVLVYHGDSYDYYMDRVDSLRMNNSKHNPDMIMHFLLKKRHLAPSHTSTTYYPFERDFFIIKKVPDILVSGHIHKSAVSRYNGILTISCACWQAKTAYQEKFGHEPDPCKIPIVNLHTGKASIIDFS